MSRASVSTPSQGAPLRKASTVGNPVGWLMNPAVSQLGAWSPAKHRLFGQEPVTSSQVSSPRGHQGLCAKNPLALPIATTASVMRSEPRR